MVDALRLCQDAGRFAEQLSSEEASGYPRLKAAFDWDVLAARKWERLAAAWSRRHAFYVPT